MRIDHLKTAVCALTLLLAGSAWADQSETRDLSGFRAITVGGSINLEVTHGDHYHVTVRTDEGDPDEVETEVSGGTLAIHPTDHWFWVFKMMSRFDHARYTVEVTLPELNKVAAGGGSRVSFKDDFTADHLRLTASGGSTMEFNGKLDRLDLHTSGGASVKLAGNVDLLNVDASGGSHTKALKLEARRAGITTSGGSVVEVNVRDKLTARASGGSVVRYDGDPAHKDINASRSGRIKAVSEKSALSSRDE